MDELILLWNVHVADTVTKPHGFGVGGECGERIKGEDMGYYGHSKGNAIVIEIAHRYCDGSHHAVYVLSAGECSVWFRIMTTAATNDDRGDDNLCGSEIIITATY